MTRKFAPHLEQLRAVVAAPSGRVVAVGGFRADGQTRSEVHLLAPHKPSVTATITVPQPVCALSFAGDEALVVGYADGAIGVIDLTQSPHLVGLPAAVHRGEVTALAFDATTGSLLTAGTDGRATLARLTGGSLRVVSELGCSAQALRCAAWEPRTGRALLAGDDGCLRIWSPQTSPEAMREVPIGEGSISAIAASEDGRAVLGSADGSIRIAYLDGAPDIEVRSGDHPHTGAVRALVLLPRRSRPAGEDVPARLFSAGDDGVLKSWPLESRRQPKAMELAKRPLFGIAWSAASARAKPEKRGGVLTVVDGRRKVRCIVLDELWDPAPEYVTLASAWAQLRHNLKASTVTVRQAAIMRLAELPEDEARELLERSLRGDAHAPTRAMAATLLGRTQRHRSRAALREALDDDDATVRAAALAALQPLELRDPIAAARAALRSRHADIRCEALTILPGLRDASPSVAGLVARALQDGDAKVRVAALRALFELDPPGSITPTRTALSRGPADVRVAALLRLVRDGVISTEAGYELAERALDDADAEVRRTAFIAVTWSRPALLGALWGWWSEAIEKLQQSGDLPEVSPRTDAVPSETDKAPLFAAMIGQHPDTALRGAHGLAMVADPRASGALLQLSRDPQAEVRRAVVSTLFAAHLAMPADTRVYTRLQWLLDDPDATVRSRAFDALAKLAEPHGESSSLALAQTALSSGQADMRTRALPIVIEFGPKRAEALHERAQALLQAALDDEDGHVRREAFRTLWSWHSGEPHTVLHRAATSRHADIRVRVVEELDRNTEAWADALLLRLVSDSHVDVASAAYRALTESKKNKDRTRRFEGDGKVHLAALASPRSKVRALACAGAKKGRAAELRMPLTRLLEDEDPEVHIQAIEALDHLCPDDAHAFAVAYASKFYGLRVRAAELHGTRRDARALAPMLALLTIPSGDRLRPSDALRVRAARAVADVGAAEAMRDYVALLGDDDPSVREMGARGMANAVRPGLELPLVTALSHDDLPVRSWVAEGLARLGDVRALPVLSGTLQHEHKPIRVGAILGFVALGAEGIRGIMQGLEDRDREVSDVVFAIVVARDVSLARRGLPPDLLTAALCAKNPEIRFAAARVLETRVVEDALPPLLEELIGPPRPARAADLKAWPPEPERRALLTVLAATLASEVPAQRYAAARVLSLRPQPLAFWREAERLRIPSTPERPDPPRTNWETEAAAPRKQGFIRRLLGERSGEPSTPGTSPAASILTMRTGKAAKGTTASSDRDLGEEGRLALAFGTYVGLVRQAAAPGEADEHHRLRRDSVQRLGVLAAHPTIGLAPLLPVLRRGLGDPHHSVRKAAFETLRTLHGEGDLGPLELALGAQAPDIGKQALDELLRLAQGGHAGARETLLHAVDAQHPEVRAAAVTLLPALFEPGSLDPWLLALASQHADVRSAVVDRLVDRADPRIDAALHRALASDHEDLRRKAARGLARRGDTRALAVLSEGLASEDAAVSRAMLQAIIELAHATPRDPNRSAAAALAVAARLEEDPDKTADPLALIDALQRIGDEAALPALHGCFVHEDGKRRFAALGAAIAIATHRELGPRKLPGGRTRARYEEPLALRSLELAVTHPDDAMRQRAIEVLRDIDGPQAETLLARALTDREPTLRIAAAEALAFRAEFVPGASVDALAQALREGRRELVLPTAEGLALRRRPEALQALLLVTKAGEVAERTRAILALGQLGDARALAELEAIAADRDGTTVDPSLPPKALHALGRMLPHLTRDDAARVWQRLEAELKEGPWTRREGALLGMRDAGDANSRGRIEALALDAFEEVTVRATAIGALAHLSSRASEAVFAELLCDGNAGIRKAASIAVELVYADAPTHANMLRLRSPYPEIAGPAATELARHGDPPTLLEQLPTISDRQVRKRLRLGLQRRGTLPSPALAALLRAPALGPSSDGAWLLGSSPEPALVPELESLAARAAKAHADAADPQHADAEEAWHAALWALRRTGRAPGSWATEALRATAPARVQCEALRSFAAATGARPDLTPLLNSAHADVRAAAAEVIAKGTSPAVNLVAGLHVGDGTTLGPLAIRALDEAPAEVLRHDDARPLVLASALRPQREQTWTELAKSSGDTTARRTAIDSLGRIASTSSVQTLEGLVRDTSAPEKIRKAAYRALRRTQRTIVKRQAAAALEEVSP